jgi:hypothetical protein
VTISNTGNGETHYIDNINVTGTAPDVSDEWTEADGFSFKWYNIGDTSNVIHEGSTYAQMADGDFIVIADYAATLCTSALDTVTIQRVTPSIDVEIYEISEYTDCSTPDGSLGAFVFTTTDNGDGDPDTLTTADGYTFNWVLAAEGSTVIATGDVIANLDGLDYTVEALDNTNGCTSTNTGAATTALTFPPPPDVVVTNINTCGGSGTLSASVGGNTSDFTFEWFDGPNIKPTPDFTGITYTVTDIGEYSVRAIRTSSSCPSDLTTEIMGDDANAPIAIVTETAQNTTCDIDGNGVALATVDGTTGDSNYGYAWYAGNNTLSQYRLPNGTDGGAFGVGEWEMTDLKSGIYTLVAENLTTNCTDTVSFEITDAFVEPSFSNETVSVQFVVKFSATNV